MLTPLVVVNTILICTFPVFTRNRISGLMCDIFHILNNFKLNFMTLAFPCFTHETYKCLVYEPT